MSLDQARESYDAHRDAHDTGECDPMICPWCQGMSPDVADFEEEEEWE